MRTTMDYEQNKNVSVRNRARRLISFAVALALFAVPVFSPVIADDEILNTEQPVVEEITENPSDSQESETEAPEETQESESQENETNETPSDEGSGTEQDANPEDDAKPEDVEPIAAEVIKKQGHTYIKGTGTGVYQKSAAFGVPLYEIKGSVIFYADRSENDMLHVLFSTGKNVLEGWIIDRGIMPLDKSELNDPELAYIEIDISGKTVKIYIGEVKEKEPPQDTQEPEETPSDESNNTKSQEIPEDSQPKEQENQEINNEDSSSDVPPEDVVEDTKESQGENDPVNDDNGNELIEKEEENKEHEEDEEDKEAEEDEEDEENSLDGNNVPDENPIDQDTPKLPEAVEGDLTGNADNPVSTETNEGIETDEGMKTDEYAAEKPDESLTKNEEKEEKEKSEENEEKEKNLDENEDEPDATVDTGSPVITEATETEDEKTEEAPDTKPEADQQDITETAEKNEPETEEQLENEDDPEPATITDLLPTADSEQQGDDSKEPGQDNSDQKTGIASRPAVLNMLRSENVLYDVTVTYFAETGIPDTAKLVVIPSPDYTKKAPAKSVENAPKKALRLTDDADKASSSESQETEKKIEIPSLITHSGDTDPSLYTYELTIDISLEEDGEKIEPAPGTKVDVEVKLPIESEQDVDVWHITENGKQLLDSNTEHSVVKFTTDGFSGFEFKAKAVKLSDISSPTFDGFISGASLSDDAGYSALSVSNATEGLTVLSAFAVSEGDDLWVTINPEEVDLGEYESVSLYAVKDGELEGIVKENIQDDSVSFKTDELSSFALVMDSGFRLRKEDTGEIILEGMMPKNAEIITEDITDQYTANDFMNEENPEKLDIISVYDISIQTDLGEYQPTEDSPIETVFINERLSDDLSYQLWHIHNDGTKELVEEFMLENTSMRFSAKGYSAYAIVEVLPPESYGYQLINDLDADATLLQSGVYIGHIENYFCTNILEENVGGTRGRTGIHKTKPANADPATAGACKYYFDPVDQQNHQYKVYCYNGQNEKQYVKWVSGSDAVNKSLSFTTEDQATTFIVEPYSSSSDSIFKLHAVGSAYYWNMQGSAKGLAIAAYNDANDVNARMKFMYRLGSEGDPFDLDGKTYGIINWSGGVTGRALMTSSSSTGKLDAKTLTVLAEKDNHADKLFVPNSSDIDMWTFHWLDGVKYALSTEINGETKYLNITADGICLEDDVNNVSPIEITAGTGSYTGQFYLQSEGAVTLTYGGAETGFGVGGDPGTEWLYVVTESELTADYYLTYTASKVSVSDPNVTNGTRLIVYTRIWNPVTEHYDFYAIDHDGSMIRCFESGDSIQWIGNRFNSLLWNFVEYYWEGTSDPNYYYELYNQYSSAFIAPQLTTGQILSDDIIGINLIGRKNGIYYSPILAWDNLSQAFSGLKVVDGNDGKKHIVACERSEAYDFYFAVVQDIVVDDETTTVSTVDNNLYGITMKMKDFDTRKQMSDFLGNDEGGAGTTLHKGLLSSNLGADGYPTTAGGSLGTLFSGAQTVNHLFIQSILNGTGYYEFDSTQNFATLKGRTGGDFVVYKEIGTTDTQGSRNSMKHGQFYPYNDLKPGSFATLNGKNEYTATGEPLSQNDPRRDESLYLVQPKAGANDIDFYFGMELEASFVQTPDGYDSWGHDIIYEFTGDDDFWLYVDDELVIDLGGIHSAVAGSVNFHTGNVVVNGVHTTLKDTFYNNYISRGYTPEQAQMLINEKFDEKTDSLGHTYYVFNEYTTHTMRIFYMERGAGASNLHMRFNLSSVKDGHVELGKEITGVDETESLLTEFPYQIWYMLPGDYMHGEIIDEHLLIPDEPAGISVKYKGTDIDVPYKPSVTISGTTSGGTPYTLQYDHVFFLKPGEEADIDLPEDTEYYRVVECGINTDVYSGVTVNGGDETVTGEGGPGYPDNRKDYKVEYDEPRSRARVIYINEVNPEALRTLNIQKILMDEMGAEEVHDDNATFDFRLYLDSEFAQSPELASMYTYHVLDENGDYCYWNTSLQHFESLGTGKNNYADLTPAEKKASSIVTSIYGSISHIPSYYTVQVREVLTGTKFKVEERDANLPKGYSRQKYVYYKDDGDAEGTDSQIPIEDLIAIGKDPLVKVYNLKGYGVSVTKTWSDADYMAERDPVYFGLYYEDEGQLRLATGIVPYPVIRMTQDSQDIYWYIDRLLLGTTFSQYVIREVSLVNPVIDISGNVTGYDSITVIPDNGTITVNGRLIGDTQPLPCEYTVRYGTPSLAQDNAQVKIFPVENSRSGIEFYKEDMEGNRLQGAEFRIFNEDGGADKVYVSDSNGFITSAFLRDNIPYTLEELKSPYTYRGYFGLQEPMTIKLVNGRITVEDGDSTYYTISADGKSMTIKNRPYFLSAVKTDNQGTPLENVHFELHKEITVGEYTGYDFNPMEGYEDLVTDAYGLIPGIDNSLLPGNYELRENIPQAGFEALPNHVQFSISPLGIITLGKHPVGTSIDSVILPNTSVKYTITIQNERSDQSGVLTLTKRVTGSLGDYSKAFTFTLDEVEDEEAGATYAYEKTTSTGTITGTISSGDTFTLKHNESIAVSFPLGKSITIIENNENYTAKWKQDIKNEVHSNIIIVELNGDSSVLMTNTISTVAPTGFYRHPLSWALVLITILLLIVSINRLKMQKISKDKKHN